MDMIPGMVTYFWFTPTRTGTFEILCAELCGVGHPQMRGTVMVDEETAYQAWLEQQQTFTQMLRIGRDAAGRTGAIAIGGTGRNRYHGRYSIRRRGGHPACGSRGCGALPSEELVDEICLQPGCQDHRRPIFGDGHLDRIGGACAVLADAAAARLSRLLRLHRCRALLPVHHHARHDHGDLSPDCAVSRRLRQLPHSADGRRAGHGVPLCQHAELLDLSAGGAGAGRGLFRAGRARPAPAGRSIRRRPFSPARRAARTGASS